MEKEKEKKNTTYLDRHVKTSLKLSLTMYRTIRQFSQSNNRADDKRNSRLGRPSLGKKAKWTIRQLFRLSFDNYFRPVRESGATKFH